MSDTLINPPAIPAFATYHEWIGLVFAVQKHTRTNAEISINAQGGNVDKMVCRIHSHADDGGCLAFFSAPIIVGECEE